MARRRVLTGRGYSLSLIESRQSSIVRRAVIICHGLGVDQTNQVVRSTAGACRQRSDLIVTFDFAGHGKSGGHIKDRTVSNFLKDLDDIVGYVTSLGATQITLIGHSIGAIVALAYAAHHPHLVTNLVLIACNADAKDKFNEMSARGATRKLKRYTIVGRTKVARNFWIDRIHEKVERLARCIRCHTLLIVGSNDRTNPPANSRQLKMWISAPRRIVTIRNADHYFVPRSHQRALATCIRGFMSTN